MQYLDANNLYGWAMSQKLPVDGFKWKKNMLKFNESVIKKYNEDSDKGYIFEVDVEYLKNVHDLHNDLPFLPGRMKINNCNKLVCNLYDKNNYVVHIRSLKQALDHGLILKIVHRVIQFNQKPKFIINIKKKDFYKDITNDAVQRFDTSNYECDRPLPTGKNKNVIGLMKDELGGKIMTEFEALRPKHILT